MEQMNEQPQKEEYLKKQEAMAYEGDDSASSPEEDLLYDDVHVQKVGEIAMAKAVLRRAAKN